MSEKNQTSKQRNKKTKTRTKQNKQTKQNKKTKTKTNKKKNVKRKTYDQKLQIWGLSTGAHFFVDQISHLTFNFFLSTDDM